MVMNIKVYNLITQSKNSFIPFLSPLFQLRINRLRSSQKDVILTKADSIFSFYDKHLSPTGFET